MTESKPDDDSFKFFIGIRFVLSVIDSSRKEQIRSMLLEGGGVDVSAYGPDCTHLIVDGPVYDEPICVAARRDGKILVTSLWVEHSFDVGMPVDHLSIMYRPPKDLNGIPTAKYLILCLTGYQRQDRDDIMTMVRLMGANFSKPLVANKVTHLICYKFEGEKYELAKKMKIKLVNHRWLEDCLRAWEILPEANYDKSGYEMKMMEAEAQDYEDDNAADIGGEKVAFPSPQHSKSPNQSLLNKGISQIHTPLSDEQLTLCALKESKSDQVTAFEESNKRHLDNSVSRANEEVPPQNGASLASVSLVTEKSPNSLKSYSRKKPRKISLTTASEQAESCEGCLPTSEVSKHGDNPSPGNERETDEKSIPLADVENALGDSTSVPKRLKKKSLAKKTLGSRLSICKRESRNQKGTLFLNKTVLANDSAPFMSGGRKDREHQQVLSSVNVEVLPADNAESSKETEKRNYHEDIKLPESINGDGETPENKYDETVLRESLNGLPESAVESTEKNQLVDRTDVKDTGMRHDTDNTIPEAQTVISGKKTRSKKSTSKEVDVDVKVTKGPKYLTKRSKTTNTAAKRAVISAKVAKANKSRSDKTNISEIEKENGLPLTGEATAQAADHELSSMDVDNKENVPVTGDNGTSNNVHGIGKNSPLKAGGVNPTRVESEPRWFILSGHRLQRKEFQKVIKRLKGNVCRDSHQWSYEATHFIVPDPVRRTEKFFAAAASGRWILKTDYLTASIEAGRLLDEEHHEWHRKGLTEDLAIDLEAPRKWRLLRQRTGHGAFYGMRIIMYGDCIVPPLDTLKRAIKAGDGTILATSPPYSSFLKSGVDFVIVDETVPHYDTWAKEFQKLEIPCILPDYLVAYVCKPGYPRDSYVQYNTHAWAEKSLKNHEKRLEEVVMDMGTR